MMFGMFWIMAGTLNVAVVRSNIRGHREHFLPVLLCGGFAAIGFIPPAFITTTAIQITQCEPVQVMTKERLAHSVSYLNLTPPVILGP